MQGRGLGMHRNADNGDVGVGRGSENRAPGSFFEDPHEREGLPWLVVVVV